MRQRVAPSHTRKRMHPLKMRHILSSAIGFLNSAVAEFRGSETDREMGEFFHGKGISRLRTVMGELEKAYRKGRRH